MSRNKKKKRTSRTPSKPSPTRTERTGGGREADTGPNRGVGSGHVDLPNTEDSAVLLTPHQVCNLLAISRSTLDRLGTSIPGRVKLGGQIRYHRGALEKWLLSQVQS